MTEYSLCSGRYTIVKCRCEWNKLQGYQMLLHIAISSAGLHVNNWSHLMDALKCELKLRSCHIGFVSKEGHCSKREFLLSWNQAFYETGYFQSQCMLARLIYSQFQLTHVLTSYWPRHISDWNKLTWNSMLLATIMLLQSLKPGADCAAFLLFFCHLKGHRQLWERLDLPVSELTAGYFNTFHSALNMLNGNEVFLQHSTSVTFGNAPSLGALVWAALATEAASRTFP